MTRREFPDKVKLAAFQRCGGCCEIPGCNAKLAPGKFTYDHRIPDQLGGEPDLDNCQVICRECDKDKTSTDAGDIARAKRRERKHIGIRKRSTFPCGKDSKFKKKVGGEVVLR
jgi:5-methylcytosine-specific restriction endonuclease McrA